MNRIYYRVSTDKQEFEMQCNALKILCKIKGIDYESCKIYQDFDISGTIADRPDYQRLLTELEDFDNIIVYEFSRLWRDLEEQSRATKQFMKTFVTVISVSDGDLNPDGDTLVADIKGSVNQHEVRRLRKRTRDGIAAKKARVAAGLEEWKPRGKDKTKRKNDGYKLRWEKWRREHGRCQ